MSTKADITIENEKQFYIYVCCDGYPNCVIPTIKPLVKEYFSKNRRKSLANFIANKLKVKLTDEKYNNGFGIHEFKDGRNPWRQYSYNILKNGDIQVYNVYEGFIIETIKLEN